MFGLTLSKLLLIALAVAAVWYGLRAYRRWETTRKTNEARRELRDGAESMVKCPVCGAYNPAGVTCSHRS